MSSEDQGQTNVAQEKVNKEQRELNAGFNATNETQAAGISDNHDVLASIIDSVRQQGENIGLLVGTIDVLGKAMKQRPTKRDIWLRDLAMLVVLILLAYNSLANRHNTDLIVSCTTPSGSCEQRSLEQQAKAVAVINLTNECQSVTLINNLAAVNKFVPIPVPPECVKDPNSGG